MTHMTDKIDYDSAQQAHWRINQVIKTMDGLTGVVEDHDKELESIRMVHSTIRVAIYTALGVYVTQSIGILEVVKSVIGL